MRMLIHDASVYTQNLQSAILTPNDFNGKHSEFAQQRLDEVSTLWGDSINHISIFFI